jgi:single-stranded-DNA-specific exonuclease
VHLAWGDAELRYTVDVLERTCGLRPAATALYRALRSGAALEEALRTLGCPTTAGRALRVLSELGLVEVDRAAGTVGVPPAERTDLGRSPAFKDAALRLAAARAYLGVAEPLAAVA